MPRLPLPGQDAGTWGSILNDYLSQSLAADGTIKTGTIGSTQLQSGAVTSAQLAPGAVTSSSLAINAITNSALADASVKAPTLDTVAAPVASQVLSYNGTSMTWVTPPTAPVVSVAGKTGIVTVNKTDVGLPNVDNTSDASKPLSTAATTALIGKADITTVASSIAAISTATTGTLVVGQVTQVDAAIAAATRTLPAASTAGVGAIVAVKKVDTTSNVVTIVRAGADTITSTVAGATSRALALAGEAVELVSDGASKWIVRSSDTPKVSLDGIYGRNAAAKSLGGSLAAVTAIPNLVWCFTPDTGFFSDQAGTVPATVGGTVRCWKNGVGTDHATTASTGLTFAQGVKGGADALNVAGSSVRLTTSGAFDATYNTGFTEFVVAYEDGLSTNHVIASSGDGRYWHERNGTSQQTDVHFSATTTPTPFIPWDVKTNANATAPRPGLMVEAFRYNGPSVVADYWYGGWYTTVTASATALALSGALNIGGLSGGSFSWGGGIHAYVAFNRALTTTEIQTVMNYLAKATRAQSKPLIQMIGNSLIAGTGSSTGNKAVPNTARYGYAVHGDKNVPSQLLDLFPADDVIVRGDAYGGRTNQLMATEIPTTTMPHFTPAAHATRIAVVWEVTNDLQQNLVANTAAIVSGATPSAYANYVTNCQTLRAQGWIVLAVTCLPRGDSGAPFYTAYQHINSLIRANWTSFSDGLVDVASDPRIGLPGAESDATYFSGDTVHLTDEGYRIVAEMIRAAVRPWIYSAPAARLLSKSVAGAVDVVLTPLESGTVTLPDGAGIIALTGVITANINVILPLTRGVSVTVRNGTTGAFAVTLKSATGTGYTLAQGKTVRIYCDGTNWLQATPEI